MSTPRLSNSQIIVMRKLVKHGAFQRGITLVKWQREHAIPLWRRRLIEIWYRQSPDATSSWEGPFFKLTDAGARLALKFFPAPRGISGAEQDS